MKKCLFLSLSALFLFPFAGFSQIKVNSDGQAVVGGYSLSSSPGTLWVKGNNSGTKPARIDIGENTGSIYFREKTAGNKQLELYGQLGTLFTGKHGVLMNLYVHDIYPEASTFYIYTPHTSTETLYVNNTLYYNYIYSMSDANVKKNITAFPSGSLSKLGKLRGVTYQMDLSEHPMLGQKTTYGEKVSEETEVASADTTTRIGFIAQELREVFPQLVKEDKDGYLSVDYTGLIPVIVEALKEQQAINKAQLEKITGMQSELNALRNGTPASKTKGLTVQEAFLYQNAPNPFSHVTVIRYFMGEAVNASLYLLDMQGKLLKSYPVSGAGEGSVEISASGLQPGMYLYSLIVNGQEVDTKRMVITE